MTIPFGFGLSYTAFKYDNLKLSASKVTAGEGLRVTADVENTGARAGDEVAQMYISHLGASAMFFVHTPSQLHTGIHNLECRLCP